MFSKIATTILLALPFTIAAPALAPRTSGEVTFYNPGLGACGETHGDSDMVVAVSAELFDSEQPCGSKIRVHGDAGDALVTVVDRCGGCAYNDLDLSPAAFEQSMGELGIGRATGTWEWA
ncbi:hypothetical protein FZEAL_10354 [Fusarium zealandicum]|uniref:RlpA-like protein double-psi beta-barrel domain-containing protein n=1 Tax=Fusarium zealandicum TaxID=1053134 RepID=A0A8H4XB80_9HYPO|nr:hypothetical protein FZEAL_10354 [Fusarium zealandicum]